MVSDSITSAYSIITWLLFSEETGTLDYWKEEELDTCRYKGNCEWVKVGLIVVYFVSQLRKNTLVLAEGGKFFDPRDMFFKRSSIHRYLV